MKFQVILFVCFACLYKANGDYEEKRLTKHLLDNYQKVGVLGRPVKNVEDTLEVKYGFALQNLMEVNRGEQSITTLLWYTIEWQDDLLKWNASEWGGVQSVRIESDDVYTPDVIPYNLVKEKVTKTKMVVYSSGMITWVPPSILTTSCSMKGDFFNEDLNCEIKFGSWSYDGSKIDLTPKSDTVDISTYTENQKYKLMETAVEKHVVEYECCPEPYIDLGVSFKWKRRY